MKKKTKEKLILILSLIVLVLGLVKHFNIIEFNKTNKVSLENETLEIHYIDVGQGDSTLIMSGNKNMLIDSGTSENKEKVVNYLKENNVEKLDYVIATHPHEDHIGGLSHIIDTFSVVDIIMPNVVHTTKSFEKLIDSIDQKRLKITEAKSGERFKLGSSDFLIIGPNKKEYKNLNDYSVSIKLDYKNTSFIFTGDAEKISEKEMVDKYSTYLAADVLKVGHHGSTTSTTEEFLKAVNPNIAIISAGKDNKYNHPNDDVLDRLNKNKVIIYDTINYGDIVLTSDGNEIKVENGENIIAKDKDVLGSVIIFLESIIDDLK